MPSFYHDRLGADIGKTHLDDEKAVFYAGKEPQRPVAAGLGWYLLRDTLVYKPKDLNRDWSPRFSKLRDKNGWI